MNTPLNTKEYFEQIGAWPKSKSPAVPGEFSHMLGTYVIGFVTSLVLTLLAYSLVVRDTLSVSEIIASIVGLAAVQFVVQMVFFLHLSKQSSSRDRLVILGCTALIVTILVSGSLWIMLTLNARMMPSAAQMTQYMQSQTGI